jgi:hypothetical protein
VSVPRKGGLALGFAVIVLAATASSAVATVRYASTGGASTGDCTSPNPADPTNPPCDLKRAVETVAVASDEVIVAPGNHDLGSNTLDVNKAINVHGQDGVARPVILSSNNSFGVLVRNAGAVFRRLEVDYTGALEALDVSSGALEQLIVHSTGAYGCLVEDNASLRDSVCFDTGGMASL